MQKKIKLAARARGMNLIELLVFIGLIFFGGCLGAGVAEIIGLIRGGNTDKIVALGTVFGGVATFLALVSWGFWFVKMDKIHPPCRCGKSNWNDFERPGSENFRNVYQCVCGKQYSWPKWQLWFEIVDKNTVHLFMKRNYFKSWREVTEQEIKNQSNEITRIPPKP